MTLTRTTSALALTLVLALQVGCGITDTTAPGLVNSTDGSAGHADPSFDYTADVEVNDLLTCRSQPYAVTTKVVGPRGGRIKVGSHVLVIPAGALDRDVLITAEQVEGSVNSVRLSPAGLSFEVPAELAMSYDNCLTVSSPKRIAETTESLKVLEVLPSKDKSQTSTVTSPVNDLSRYAVAY